MDHIILDTNYILRYLLRDSEEFYEKCNHVFKKIKIGEKKAILSESVLAEVVFVATKVYKVPKEELVDTLLNWISYYKGLRQDEWVEDALILFKRTSFHIVDCLVTARASRENLQLFTFDQALIKLNRS